MCESNGKPFEDLSGSTCYNLYLKVNTPAAGRNQGEQEDQLESGSEQ